MKPSAMQTRSNIRQVAERAGVSKSTVSNVLLGRFDNMGSQTRESVLKAIRDLDYVPVRPSLQNRHVPTRVIAVPMDEPRKIGWAINSGTSTGLCESAMKHGYDVMLLLRPDPDWAVERSEVQFLDRRSDGIIFASPIIGETSRTFEALARHEIPTVVCYRRDVPEGIGWVDPDNRSAMFQAVGHLVEMGHTKIAHFTVAQTEDWDKVERRRYFQDAVRQHGLHECADWVFSTAFFAATPELVRQILETGATAVVCMNDLLAVDLLKATEKAGLSVPDDLSITGMDDVGAAPHNLTTIAFSFSEIGANAADALVEMIQGRPAAACCRELPVHLVRRQSVKDVRS